MEETIVKQDEQPKPDYKLVIPILAGFVVLTFLAVFMIPSINALFNPAEKVIANINSTVMYKGQVLVYAYSSNDLKWEALAIDETTFYYYILNEDGTRIESTYTKSKNTKPYLYWISKESGVPEDYVYPETQNIEKQKNTVVDFIYVGDNADSYVNYLITPLLKDALPSTTINEHCYVNCTSNETIERANELVSAFKIKQAPAIIINNKYVYSGLVGSEQQSTKARYEAMLHFLCMFIEGEPKCG